jgi:hypothetical protein
MDVGHIDEENAAVARRMRRIGVVWAGVRDVSDRQAVGTSRRYRWEMLRHTLFFKFFPFLLNIVPPFLEYFIFINLYLAGATDVNGRNYSHSAPQNPS